MVQSRCYNHSRCTVSGRSNTGFDYRLRQVTEQALRLVWSCHVCVLPRFLIQRGISLPERDSAGRVLSLFAVRSAVSNNFIIIVINV